MTYKVASFIWTVVALLSSACFRADTVSSNVASDIGQVREQSPTSEITAREQKELTQKELAQLAIASGEREVKSSYSNSEYGYSVTIPEVFIGVSPASPYPQHGFSIP